MSMFLRLFWCLCDEMLFYENMTLVLFMCRYFFYINEEGEIRRVSNLFEVNQFLEQSWDFNLSRFDFREQDLFIWL